MWFTILEAEVGEWGEGVYVKSELEGRWVS
jgi:hypothetical protein